MEQKKYWQSFGELNQSEAYNKEVKDEFKDELPFVADESKSFMETAAPRRDFLKYLGFSTAAAAVAASIAMQNDKFAEAKEIAAADVAAITGEIPEITFPAETTVDSSASLSGMFP